MRASGLDGALRALAGNAPGEFILVIVGIGFISMASIPSFSPICTTMTTIHLRGTPTVTGTPSREALNG
jgi:hypothetical protein